MKRLISLSQNPKAKALKQFTLGKGKSAGRGSSGRITSFHRGGGSKRLQRTVDLKRTTPSVGIVERFEYDPNRSSRLALVRWIQGVHRKSNPTQQTTPPNIPEPTAATPSGLFSFSSLPGKVLQRNAPGQTAAYAWVGLPTGMPPPQGSSGGKKMTNARDVFLSALAPSKAKGETASLFKDNFPRIGVAGSKPTFFALQMGNELHGKNTFTPGEVRKWNPDSNVWANRIKRKAALSWQSFGQRKN